jgi:hypothetical protein
MVMELASPEQELIDWCDGEIFESEDGVRCHMEEELFLGTTLEHDYELTPTEFRWDTYRWNEDPVSGSVDRTTIRSFENSVGQLRIKTENSKVLIE